MNMNPFQPGDKVYHVTYGPVTIHSILDDEITHIMLSEKQMSRVVPGNVRNLSFSPWKPDQGPQGIDYDAYRNKVNPFKEGDTVYRPDSDRPMVVRRVIAIRVCSVQIDIPGKLPEITHVSTPALSYKPWPPPNHIRPGSPEVNPFRVGDKVYHITKGLCEVTHIDTPLRATIVKPGEPAILPGLTVWTEHLSFTPWPKPNHQRPTEQAA